MAMYSASSMSWKNEVGGTIRLMLAPGATACAHSTSMLISTESADEQLLAVGIFVMVKFDEVSAGRPNCAENLLASLRIVGEPHQSMIPMVCPLPSNPSAYRPERL